MISLRLCCVLWVYLPCKISVTCESTIRFNVWGSRESPSLLSSMPLVNQYVNNYNNIQRATIAYPLPLVQHAACCRSVARWIVVVHRCCWLQRARRTQLKVTKYVGNKNVESDKMTKWNSERANQRICQKPLIVQIVDRRSWSEVTRWRDDKTIDKKSKSRQQWESEKSGSGWKWTKRQNLLAVSWLKLIIRNYGTITHNSETTDWLIQ